MSFGFLGDPSDDSLRGMFNQMSRVFASLGSNEGPVPPSLVRQTALDGITAERSALTRAALDEAFRLADLWLDQATSIPATSAMASAWTRREWVEQSVPLWIQAVEPIAEKMAATMTESLGQMGAQAGGELAPILEQFGAGMGQLQAIFERLGGAMFATQLGQALSKLANEVMTSTDIGIATAAPGQRVLLPSNVEAWAESIEVELEPVVLFLALREAAAVRLFATHAWLRDRLVAAIHDFANGITIDIDALQQQAERAMEAMQGSTDPEAMAEAASVFELPESPQQRAALQRLETHLALIEGWVDHVVTAAAGERLPEYAALAEMVRRRRATGGPAEAIFATLVGLELRPRRLRDAARLWAALEHEFGMQARDEIWLHQETMPTHDALDDPLAYVETVRLLRNIPDDLSSL